MKKNILGQYNDSSYLNESWKTKIREVYSKCILAFDPNSSEMQKIEKLMTMLEDNSEKEKSGKANVVGGLSKKVGQIKEQITEKNQEAEEPKKRKHGCLTAILIVVGIIILLNAIGAIFLKSDGLDSINNFSNEIINQSVAPLKNQNLKANE